MNAALSMKILALEFSSSQRRVAVAENDSVLATVTTDNLKTSPLTLIDKVLQKARLDRATIEVVALGIGPGSYTGIRSAIATAQGWQLARNINLLPISSAEVLAATARANGQHGETHLLIDAQRNEYYHATWNLTDESQTETAPLRIIDMEAVEGIACPIMMKVSHELALQEDDGIVNPIMTKESSPDIPSSPFAIGIALDGLECNSRLIWDPE